MTHDPSRRLATAEEIMSGNSPFEPVDTPLGKMERWRAEALIIGTTSGIQDVYNSIRSDATAQEARANADKAQHSLLRHFFKTVGKFLDGVDNMVSRVEAAHDAAEEKRRAEAEFEEEPLTLPPDFDRPQDLPPSEIGDETHQPGGELH